MLTTIINIRINSSEKLKNFESSLKSLLEVTDYWLVNVRGIERINALSICKEYLPIEKTKYFKLLVDDHGWLNNFSKMLIDCHSSHVFIFNEDHIRICKKDVIRHIISNLENDGIDYIPLSWWPQGNFYKSYQNVQTNNSKYYKHLLLTRKTWNNLIRKGHNYYLVSSLGIFSKNFLSNIIEKDMSRFNPELSGKIVTFINTMCNYLRIKNRFRVYTHINKLFGYKLSRYSPGTPFELEKDPSRVDILPFRIALPKQELLACIDDDHGVEGYQLIKRGLYPTSTIIQNKSIYRNMDKYLVSTTRIKKGKELKDVNFYARSSRIFAPDIITIYIIKGQIKVKADSHSTIHKTGDMIAVYANKQKRITAAKDSTILIVLPDYEKSEINYDIQRR